MKTAVIRNVDNAMAKYPKAKRIAVENFTAGTTWGMEAAMNLEADAKSYKWNSATVNAIKWVLGR